MKILLILGLVLCFILVAATRYKVHPFYVLLLSAIFSGLAFGFPFDEIIQKITSGFGSTLAGIGIIIALGATIGVLMEKSGATSVMAFKVIQIIGLRNSPLAMNLAGYIISIPVFCDSGFILLSSLNKALAGKTGIPLLIFAVALASGLYATHVFVPPTPGPLAAAAILEADIGSLMLYGLILAIPVSLVGFLWAKIAGSSLPSYTSTNDIKMADSNHISATLAFAPVFVPIILIALGSIASYPARPFGEGVVLEITAFLGQPVMALLIGVAIAAFMYWKTVKDGIAESIGNALKDAGDIILLTGAGGAFGSVIRDAGVENLFNDPEILGAYGLLIVFVIASLLKTAQGSSTVAIITTAAIVAPLLAAMGFDSQEGRVLVVLAIGAGAITVSHVNDSFFWVVAKFSDLNVKQALKGHTIATFIQGFVALIILYALKAVLL